jgi:ribonuclease HI
MFISKELKAQLKFKLDNRCSKNQAEQLVIAKALETIDEINIAENSPHTIDIFNDSGITIDSLKNVNNHSYLNEDIRKRISSLERNKWTVEFSCIKAHIGIYGNELAENLAKDVACNKGTTVSFNRIAKSMLYNEIEEATKKWQEEWEDCTKAAITKQIFPNVRDRVKLDINVNPNFTAIVTGHGKTRAYLHRFKILENATCPCNKRDQTIDHLISVHYFKHTENFLVTTS